MGRIRKEIDVGGQKCWTLFDTGARNTYVISKIGARLNRTPVDRPTRAGLAGGVREVKELAMLKGNIEGHPVWTHAAVVDEIGKDEDGKPIEILFGAGHATMGHPSHPGQRGA